jgi:high-affinity K+ transport system ATPase subunit B
MYPQRVRFASEPTALDAAAPRADAARRTAPRGVTMISVLIGVLIIVVVGAICFWAIDKFATDGRLANLLKLLVVLICLGAILQRVLPLTY